MRQEINEIMEMLQINERLSGVRQRLLLLDSGNSQRIRDEITGINRLIPTESVSDNDDVGMRFLLVGCCYFELNELDLASQSLDRAMMEIWASDINKSLAHWLTGLIQNARRNFTRAIHHSL